MISLPRSIPRRRRRTGATHELLTLALFACLSAAWAAPSTPAGAPAGADSTRDAQMFRALHPKVIIEVAESDVNACLQEHPDLFRLPRRYAAPRVVFGAGLVEVSARTKVLLAQTRVSVTLAPEMAAGHLRLTVRKVRASGIPLPRRLERGVGDGIAATINQALDRNDLQLVRVEVMRGLLRVTAEPRAPVATP